MTVATEQLWQLNNHESRTTRKANNCKEKQPWEQSLLSKHQLQLPLACGFLWWLVLLADWLPFPTPALFLQPSSPPVDCCLPCGCCIHCQASAAPTAVAPALWLFALPKMVAGTLTEWLQTPALFLQPLPPPVSEVGNFSVYSFTWLTVMRLTRASYVKSRNSNIQKNKKADGLGQQNWQLTTTFLMNTVH